MFCFPTTTVVVICKTCKEKKNSKYVVLGEKPSSSEDIKHNRFFLNWHNSPLDSQGVTSLQCSHSGGESGTDFPGPQMGGGPLKSLNACNFCICQFLSLLETQQEQYGGMVCFFFKTLHPPLHRHRGEKIMSEYTIFGELSISYFINFS